MVQSNQNMGGDQKKLIQLYDFIFENDKTNVAIQFVMTRKIARRLTNDKRTSLKISADVLKTKVHLTVGNMVLKLSTVEARRIGTTLEKAVSIQDTSKADSKPASLSFSKPQLQVVQVEKPKLTTLEKRLEVAKYVFQQIKTKHHDLPPYRKSKIVVHNEKRHRFPMGNALARCGSASYKGKDWMIYFKQKFLLQPEFYYKRYGVDNSFDIIVFLIGKVMCHEMAHLKIKSCRHCKKFWERNNQHLKSLYELMQTEEFWSNIPEECFD